MTRAALKNLAEKSRALIEVSQGKLAEDLKSGNLLLEEIPDSLLSEEIILAALNGGVSSGLSEIPDIFMTDQVIELALSKNWQEIWNIPVDRLKSEHLEIAAKQSYSAIHRVPHDFITEDLIRKMIQWHQKALTFVPESKLTAELCAEAVKATPRAVLMVPKKFLTEEMCIQGVIEDPSLAQHIPEEFKTPRVYKEMCEKGGVMAPKYLSCEVGANNEAYIKMAIYVDYRAIINVHKIDMNQSIADFAFAIDKRSFSHLQKEFKQDYMCRDFIMALPNLINDIPEELMKQDYLAISLRGIKKTGIKDTLNSIAGDYFDKAQRFKISTPENVGSFAVELLKVAPGYLETLPFDLVCEDETFQDYLSDNFDELTAIITPKKSREIASFFAGLEAATETPRG